MNIYKRSLYKEEKSEKEAFEDNGDEKLYKKRCLRAQKEALKTGQKVDF